jgi:signal transduction histidine kinase
MRLALPPLPGGTVEEFSRRSNIPVSFDLPPRLGRLRDDVEITRFRALQESLTNTHRHAESPRVEVQLYVDAENVTLAIRDYGRGIPPDVLQLLRKGGSNLGVGLAGMRERVRELGGHLDIQSGAQGTMLVVTIPLTRHPQRGRFSQRPLPLVPRRMLRRTYWMTLDHCPKSILVKDSSPRSCQSTLESAKGNC